MASTSPRNVLPHQDPGFSIAVTGAGPYVRDPMNTAFMDFYGTRVRPGEGWKFHISVRPQNAVAMAAAVLPVLTNANVWHKYVDSPYKYANFTGTQVGKFIVVYSINTQDARAIVQMLAPYVGDDRGPLIAGDAKVPDTGCLYARYGGFVSEFIMSPTGGKVLDNRNRHAPFWAPGFMAKRDYNYPVYTARDMRNIRRNDTDDYRGTY